MIRRYEDKDYESICWWFKLRNMKCLDRSSLPKCGFIAENVACGFLYKTDSDIGILECYISNPDASTLERTTALNRITVLLLGHAAFEGIKHVKYNTNLNVVRQMAKTHGFRFVGDYSSYFKEI